MGSSKDLFDLYSGPPAGREPELAALTAAWRDTLRNRPTVVAVEGPAGIGKSALVAGFLRRTAPPLVARSYGDEAWERRPWEVVRQLTHDLPDAPDTHGGATADTLTELADPALVARALAADLRRAAPLVVVVDDAHWGDRPSMTALRLAARSLRTEPVLFVVAHVPVDAVSAGERPWARAHDGLHEGWRRLFESEGGAVVRLGGLSADTLLRLAPEWGQPRLSPAGAAHLHELTGGNPLHARQLLQQVDPHTLAYGRGPLPAHRSMPLTLISRLGSCAPATRDLIAAGAVLGRRFALAQARELAGLTGRESELDEALDEAVRSGLVVEAPGTGGRTLAFPNGVIGDYVYSDMSPGRRRRLHGGAGRLGGPDALWHRIAAEQGRDEALATEAERESQRQLSLGNLRLAAVYAGHALELTPPGPHVRARLLTAVEALLVSGDASTARRYAGDLPAQAPGPWLDYVHGYLVLLDGQVAEAGKLFRRALDAVREGVADPAGTAREGRTGAPADLEARVTSQLAIIGVVQLDYRDMVEYGVAAVAAETREAWVRAFAWFAKTVGTALAGDAPGALRDLGAVHLPGAAAGLDGLVARGMIRLWSDDLAGAHADLSGAVERATRGEALRVGQALGFLGETEYRRGNLAEAARLTASAIGDAAENGRVWDYPLLHALACYPLAAQGRWEEAARHTRQATDWSQLIASPMSFAFAAAARAAVAQAAEDLPGLLDAAEAMETHYSSREPGTHLFGPVRADALSRLGRTGEAARSLADFVARTDAVGRTSARLAVARVRAQISAAEGAPAAAVADCEEALRLAERAGLPLEGARVRLLQAGQLAALGQGLAAEKALRSALRVFEEAGATAYADQARRLAEELGLRLTGPVSALAVLTRREREAVQLMRGGLSNQAIARRLGVAEKTVESHLQHAYDKLHLGREQLRALKLDDDEATTAD
ncbi:AAA family ATPase [Streptomyces sp. NPDC005423]|uniref:helix-turn-helix transcriptional regulator n=1 Tax=Streptomyces sp. NPDC005423 TaxID=3155343 RepID=UPI00339DBF55